MNFTFMLRLGRMARISTKRHRRLCERTGHIAGTLTWWEKYTDAAWLHRSQPWCPRCERPVRIQADQGSYLATFQAEGPH